MKATRFLLLLAMASTACLPGSGISPAQTVVANPDPQLGGAGLGAPAVRPMPARSASEAAASPASSGNSKKTLLIVAGVVVVAALVIVLASSGGSGGLGY